MKFCHFVACAHQSNAIGSYPERFIAKEFICKFCPKKRNGRNKKHSHLMPICEKSWFLSKKKKINEIKSDTNTIEIGSRVVKMNNTKIIELNREQTKNRLVCFLSCELFTHIFLNFVYHVTGEQHTVWILKCEINAQRASFSVNWFSVRGLV